MSKLTRLALAILVLALAPAAARAGEVIHLYRTLEDPSVQAVCPPDDTVLLGALLYAPRTRASDAQVMKDAGHPIGTATGCGKLLSPVPFDPRVQNPFAMRFDLPDGNVITAAGTCTITNLSFPQPGVPVPLFLVTCALNVDPNPALGVIRGSASSSSVFTAGELPGFGTGSFWNVHLYLAD